MVRNSAFNLTGQGLYAVFHLLSIVILARALGAGLFGQYYTFFALILVVQLLAEAGLGTILTARLVRHPDGWPNIVTEGASLFAAVSLASVAVFVALGAGFVWWRGHPALFWAFAAAGIACAAMQVQRFCASVLQASELFGYENVARVTQGALFAGLAVLFVAGGRIGVTAALAILAVTHWIAAAFLVVTLYRRHALAWPSRPRWRSWLGEAGPLGLGDVVRGLTWQLDTLLLGLLQPASVVGLYSVAYRPLGPLNWLPRAVLSASFPLLTRAAHDREALQAAFAQSARVLMIVSFPIAITLFLCAEPFVLLVAGPEYLEAAVPLRLLIWIAVLSFLTMHFRFLLAAIGKAHTYAGLVLGIFALEAATELAMIPRWGYLGAAAGSLLGESVFAVAGLALFRRSGIHRVQWGMLSRAAVAGAAMAAVLWPARHAASPLLVPLATLAIGLYFVLCVWFGALRKQEVRDFHAALVRLLRPAPKPV